MRGSGWSSVRRSSGRAATAVLNSSDTIERCWPLLEGGGEFSSPRDAELAEGVSEVGLHRLEGDEQRLCDLAIGPSLGGERGDAQLAGRERQAALDAVAARAGPGRGELLACALGQRPGAAAHRGVERSAQGVAGVVPVPGAPQRSSQVAGGVGVLDASGAGLEDCGGFA
jgi:hypothetical protein